jgi:hypothetical protein
VATGTHHCAMPWPQGLTYHGAMPWPQGLTYHGAKPWPQGLTYHGAMPWRQGLTYHGAMPWRQRLTYHGVMPWRQRLTYHGAMPWREGLTYHGSKRVIILNLILPWKRLWRFLLLGRDAQGVCRWVSTIGKNLSAFYALKIKTTSFSEMSVPTTLHGVMSQT